MLYPHGWEPIELGSSAQSLSVRRDIDRFIPEGFGRRINLDQMIAELHAAYWRSMTTAWPREQSKPFLELRT